MYRFFILFLILYPLQIFAIIAPQNQWFCICYSELNEQNQPMLVTSCRTDYHQCSKLADKITLQGSKTIIKESAISGCVEISGPFPWSSLTQSQELDWLESKLKGATWSPNGCFLDEKIRNQNPPLNLEEILFNQKIDQALKESYLTWNPIEISNNKKNLSKFYQQLIQKTEIGEYHPNEKYFQINRMIIETKYHKDDSELLKNYFQPFESGCTSIIHQLSTDKSLKLKRIGWFELGKNYYVTSSKGVTQKKVIKLGYDTQSEPECSGSYLYPYYQLEKDQPDQCSIISNYPLKYPSIRKFEAMDIMKEQDQLIAIKNIILNQIKNILPQIDASKYRLNDISVDQFSNVSNYDKIYRIQAHQFYVIVVISSTEQAHHFILNVDLKKQKVSLLNYFNEGHPISISIACQIDRNQDGKAEIPVVFSAGEWGFEREIIDDQWVELKDF